MTIKKQHPLAYKRRPPPRRKGDGWQGYVKPFVEILRAHPDQWFQFRPGVAHDSSRVQRIKQALPGVIVTTRRWYRPKKPYSRPRTKTTRCDIYAVWPSTPGIAPEFVDINFTAEDAEAMQVEYPPRTGRKGPDPEDPEFDWSDFT